MVGVEVGDPERASHFVTTTSIFSSFVYFVDNSSLVVFGILEEGVTKENDRRNRSTKYTNRTKKEDKNEAVPSRKSYIICAVLNSLSIR